MLSNLAALCSLSLTDLPVALALCSLVLSFGISTFGLACMAVRRGDHHE